MYQTKSDKYVKKKEYKNLTAPVSAMKCNNKSPVQENPTDAEFSFQFIFFLPLLS